MLSVHNERRKCLAGLKILDRTPVRGRSILHRGAVLARRRRGQDREPRLGGPGALDRPHRGGCRCALFSAVQLTEAFGCDQPEGPAWARAPQAPRQMRRRDARELRSRRDRASWPRLRGDQGGQSGDHHCQVKGFGTGSPFEKYLAFDMIAQASGGLMSITGEEDGRPCKAGATVGDTGTGMVMAISILAAYVRRLPTGPRDHLAFRMQDS